MNDNVIIDISRQLDRRRQYDYESGTVAIDTARARIAEICEALDNGQLLVAVDDIHSAVYEVRAILNGEAKWPRNVIEDSPESTEAR